MFITGLLPKGINWSTQSIKINKINTFLKNYFHKPIKITYISQEIDWTLPDNSINKYLYYKDHLNLIKNRNTKLSNSIMKPLRDVLSLSSSQLSSSCLSLSSLLKFLPSFSSSRSNLPSVQILIQSPSSRLLSSTAKPFKPKR